MLDEALGDRNGGRGAKRCNLQSLELDRNQLADGGAAILAELLLHPGFKTLVRSRTTHARTHTQDTRHSTHNAHLYAHACRRQTHIHADDTTCMHVALVICADLSTLPPFPLSPSFPFALAQKRLSLATNEIEGAGAMALVNAAQFHPHLGDLDLSHNFLSDLQETDLRSLVA